MEIPSIQTEREKNAYISLKISYEHLKDKMSQTCFLLCALYPEDDSINVEDLVQYAWGLNLYDKANSIEEMRIQVLEVIDYLKDSCLLEDGDVGRFVKRGGDFGRFPWRFQPEVIRRLSQLEELYLPELNMGNGNFKFPELEKYKMCISCFSICSGNEEMFSFGHTFDVARSLKFEGVFPYNAVSQLLGNLESLQVSRIKDEYVECLTNKTQQKVSVSMILRNLKLVRIDYCKNLKVVFQMEEVEENEAPLLSNLKILRLQRLPDLSCIWELPTQHVRLESLVELTILHCRHLKSLFSHSLAQSLVLLEKLEIIYCPELKQVVTELEGDEGEISSTINSHTSLSFPKLTTVYISTCDGLEYIFPTQHVRLESLVVLTIKKCPRLKSLCSVSLAQSLVQLKGLEVSYCDEMKQIVTELEGDEGEISSTITSHNSLCFPELGDVSISNCYGLEYIFPTSMSPQGLQGLTLNVEACPQLKQVFRVAKDRVGNDSMLQHQQFLKSLYPFQ
ncbi:probable disease resistance protein At4g27220 [Gossypium hirsutum]|uniref:Probable disease resistance protein At4g27220 n=1 Tax=Gossypium hirsutum TaxID=3635 RepID=A0A1U8MM39_GOSHI|nr:probable disease resistance protein At4g27220 [Gossypium hirsutum]